MLTKNCYEISKYHPCSIRIKEIMRYLPLSLVAFGTPSSLSLKCLCILGTLLPFFSSSDQALTYDKMRATTCSFGAKK